MKKVTFLFMSLFFFVAFLNAQQLNRDQVPRDKVVFEIFTGVNCPYCPAAANGAATMLENGLEVAVAKYHTSAFSIPLFYTAETNARAPYYSISSYPTTKVDGILTQVGGGGSSASNYSAYLPLYNQRIAILSDFTINLSYALVSGNNYEATVVVTKVGTSSATNLKLRVLLTETAIPYNWQGMSVLNNVVRDMMPDQNGTVLNFTSGNSQTIVLPFTLGATWVKENCELIAFVQNDTGKEILQGTKKTMNTPLFDLDAELLEVHNLPVQLSVGALSPEITIKNKGAQILTSCNINFTVNDELVYSYPWTGSLSYTDKSMFKVPEFTFPLKNTNNVVVSLSDPNGNVDNNPSNDTQAFDAVYPEVVQTMLVLIFKTDNNPQETTYQLVDATGTVIESGGPFTQPNLQMKDTMYLTGTGAHRFIWNDAGGNGITGFYTLRAKINTTMTTIGANGTFAYQEVTDMIGYTMSNFGAETNVSCDGFTTAFNDYSAPNITSWQWTFEGGSPATSTAQNPSVTFANAGAYDVSLTVSNGTNSNTFTRADYINVLGAPQINFASIPDMCTYWPAQELTQATPTGGEYSGPGVVDGWFYPETAGVGTHTITYTYQDEIGCENSSTQPVYVDNCTGITELSGKGIQVYPNPLTENSTLSFYLSNPETVNISVFNNLGMEVIKIANQQLQSGIQNINLNVTSLENGIYFIRIQAGSDIQTKKVTVVK
jgi:PKD repeat protein